MKKYRLLLFLLLGLCACDKEVSIFEVSSDGLIMDYKPVAGGAILEYTLPNNRNIFAMNIRYKNSQGHDVLKTCGYSGKSVMLDGFTQATKVKASFTFVDNYSKESAPFEYEFETKDSAPWAFFESIEVKESWDGFQVSYGPTDIATGMGHIFYLGINPSNNLEDTILVKSFPISSKGDTMLLVAKQENRYNTVVIRTEDFKGYRVKQQIYHDIESFITEKFKMTPDNFDDGGLSIVDADAETGVEYLFDGELKGRRRLEVPLPKMPTDPHIVFGTYLAGPQAVNHPFIIDLKESRVPAKIHVYAMYKMSFRHEQAPGRYAGGLGYIWRGDHRTKLPCQITLYGNNSSPDPDSGEWVKLGDFNQSPKTDLNDRWYYLENIMYPTDVEELDLRDPVYTEVNCPATNDKYRYLKVIVNNTFDNPKSSINYNPDKYVTMVELEVYVKKN